MLTGRGTYFRVSGLDCVEEVTILKAEIGPLVGGGDNLAFDVLNGRMIVLNEQVDDDAIIRAVARTGMTAAPWSQANAGHDQDKRRKLQAALAAASGLATGLGWATDALGAGLWPSRAAFAAAILIGLWVVLPKALLAVRRVRPDMNLLMTVAVIGAVALGDWLEAATVSFLFALSLALESWSAGRARRAIAALMDLAPPTVRVKGADGREVETAPEEVAVGAVFVVQPGERVPLDGRVLAGESSVNQAPITGESVPVAKSPGAEVFAGTVNGDGALEIENTKPAQDTTLAHVTRMVAEAQSNRSATERWVDKFAAIYTPVVMAIALAILLGPPLVLGASWGEWIYRSLVLLVIACPCALVISTPVTVVAAMAAAARAGVLVKGGEHLESPARLKVVAFDKTGTVTEGKLAVETVVPLNGHSEAELLARVAALEARSSHPIAQAILAHAAAQGVSPAPADNVQAIPGKGATGTIDGRSYWLGSHRYLEELGEETPEIHDLAERLETDGHSVVVVGSDRHVCGLIALSDRVRPEAKEALSALRRAGVERLVMLTGDNRATAERIAAGLGIDEVRAELLPEDKVAAVEDLVARHGTVAMVGDGVNDAPAMVKASLSIAMGAVGTDTAIETADLALMSDDLGKLAWLVGHSRRMQAVLRQNISFALGIKALFTVLAFAGIATLWGAIAADMGASLLVVFNGLRILRQGASGTV
ncbi:heavy metal translocating P-type ATPase [Magnetospirillum sp. 64-120]|uniref:heavy metal translocating P-type ATPase n=1 Tax=Magnetospirillum sp. 64-120 TaxID=1895778 RepID=UPI000927E27D|nr:heavy metal translocating P-type ATPase [Magnetospirillum sp. 64-120]OJX79935.1 MAG: cadmium-translocating P-type ATPase [Magnetospirillum sp. 64-120]